MFKRGKKGERKEGKQMTKKEKKLAAEVAAKEDLMRAAGIEMPNSSQQQKPESPLSSSQRSANRARERMKQQKRVKLSFKDRLTDKVASGMRGTIAKVLNKALGDFIEGINADDFHFSMSQGRVELSNLRLKKEFFHTLNLPLELVASYVGSITLDIPFQNLKTKPIVVELSQVYATLAPSPDIDPKIMLRSKLEGHDKAWADAKDEEDDEEESTGMAAKYMQKIMDNIQVTIQDIHIRYEDGVSSQRSTWDSDASSTFAAGITIDSIELRSFFVDLTTGEWQKKFVEEEQRYLNKMFTIGQALQGQAPRAADDLTPPHQSGLAVYINAGEQPYPDPGSDAWIQQMWDSIARDGRAANGMAYAFGPMSLELQISIDKQKQNAAEKSRVWHGEHGSSNEVEVHFTGIETHLRQKHASIAFNLVSWMQNIYRWREFDERPTFAPSLGINAREWWKFAGRCIVEQVRTNREKRSIHNVRESLRTVNTYVSLYERHSRNGRPHLKDLTEKEAEFLYEIEDNHSFDMIVACRSVAWQRLLNYDLEQEKQGQPRKMTLAQIEMVDPRAAFRLRDPIEFKPDVSFAKIKILNERFAFELSQESASLVHLVVDKFSVEAYMFGNGGGGAAVRIQGLAVHDKFTHNPIFPHIIQRHDSGASDQPVFNFEVEKKVTKKVENERGAAVERIQQAVSVQLAMEPLQIVANYNMVPVLQNFATFHGNDADFTETKLKAANAFNELYNDYMMQMSAAKEGLEMEQATENRMNAHLTIGGPVICLPQRFTRDEVDPIVLVVDTGRITVTTSQNAHGDYDVSKVSTRGAEVYYCPTNTYFAQHKQILHLWCTYDEDNSGSLSMDEVRKLLCDISNNGLTDEEMQQHMQSMDEDMSGEIEFGEFLDYFKASLYVEWLWKQADADKSGSLSEAELKDVLNLLGKRTTDKGFLKIWTALDADKSGAIEKTEFLEWWKLSGQFTGQKMVIVDSARLQGEVSICTKFDPTLTKMIGSFQLSSTEIRVSDREIRDLSDLFACVLASIKIPEPSPSAKGVPRASVQPQLDNPSGNVTNKLLMGSESFEATFEGETPKARMAEAKRTRTEQADAWRRASKKATAALAAQGSSSTPPGPVKRSEPTKAAVAQQALKEWKLMDVVIHVEDLHIVLSDDDGQLDLLELHLRGLNANITKRPLDEDVGVGFETFEVIDCQQVEHQRADTHTLMIQGASVSMRSAQAKSPYAVDYVPLSGISATVARVDTGIRMGLLQELSTFGEAATGYLDVLVDPEQAALNTAEAKVVEAIKVRDQFLQAQMRAEEDDTVSDAELERLRQAHRTAEDKLGALRLTEKKARTAVEKSQALRKNQPLGDVEARGAGGGAEDGAMTGVIDRTRQTVQLDLREVGLRLVPDEEDQAIVSDFRISDISASVVRELGGTQAKASVGSMVLMHGELPDTTAAVLADKNVEKAILVWIHDGGCIRVNFNQPSPRDPRNLPMAVKARLSGLDLMISASFIRDVANWALHNPFMDAVRSKDQSSPGSSKPIEVDKPKPATVGDVAPSPPPPVEVDICVEEVALLIPNESSVSGLRIGLERLVVAASTVPDHQNVDLVGLTIWTYVGEAHHLRSAHESNRHMVVAEPLSLGISVRKEELKRTISASHPGMFTVRISYCDLRLLKHLGEYLKDTVDDITPAPSHASESEPELELDPEPEPEPEPEQKPELELQQKADSASASSATVHLVEPLRLGLDIYDDAVGRNRARLLLCASILVQEISVNAIDNAPKIDIGVGLSVNHCNKQGVQCPLLEPVQITVATDSAAKTSRIAAQKKINLIVTESLLVDLQRVAAVWPDEIDNSEAVEPSDDYESIIVKNETGVELYFGTVGSPADRKFTAGMQATLSSFGTKIHAEHNIHVQLSGKEHGHHAITDSRNPVGDICGLAFRLGAHEFVASTLVPSVQHLEQGGRKRNNDKTILCVDVTRHGAANIVQLHGAISVRNGLPDPVTVAVHTPKLTLFESQIEGVTQLQPTGTKCGLPLSVRLDDESAMLTIRRSESSVDIRLTELIGQNESKWLQVDDTWVCLAVTLTSVRSKSISLAENEKPAAHVWVQKAVIDIVPSLQVVSLIPEFPLKISYSVGKFSSTFELDAADGDSSGQPTEVLLKGSECVNDEVSIGAQIVMHGVTFSTSMLHLIHGATTSTLADSMILSSEDKRNLPIRLELLYDTLPSGCRVVRIWVAYCLVNSSGQPIMVCRDDDHSNNVFSDDDLPAVRTCTTEKFDPSKVKDWLCHRNGTGRDISLLPGADGEKLRLKIGHDAGSWSEPFRVDNPGTGGMIEISGGEHGDVQLSVDSTSDNPGSARMSPWCPALQAAPPTKYVRLFPRTLISNHTGKRLYLAQASTKHESKHAILDQICELQDQEMTVLEFPHLEGKGVQKSMALRLSEDAVWSGAVNCDTVQQVPMWLRDGPDGDLLVHITVRTMDNIIFIHVSLESKESPEFCLCNSTECSVTVRQIGCEPSSVIPAGKTLNLGWDFPERDKKFVAEYSNVSGMQVVEIKPDAVGPHPTDSSVYVVVEGGTRKIRLTKSTSHDTEQVEEGIAEKPAKTVVLLVDGVGLSLTSTAGLYSQELLAVSVGQIQIEVSDDAVKQTMALTVESLQVDSMLVASPSTPVSFPVILRTMTGLEEHGHTPKPALCVTTVTRKQPIPWAKHMDAVSFLLQEIELQVELSLLVPLLEFVQNMQVQLQLELPEYSQRAETERLQFAEFGERNDMDEPILFIRFLQIHPISVKLSFHMGKVQIPPVARPFAVIAKSIATIDQTPIKLTSVVIDDACGYTSEVTGKIGMHYAQQGKRQIYKIIGSMGILGNPVGLVNKLGSGVTMFFYEPIQGIHQGPGHFIAGLGQGTAALVGGTVEGAFHAPTEVTAALSQGLNTLADSGSKAGSGQRAHSTMQGLGFLAHDFGHDLSKTVTSVFVAPVKGAKTGGASGFMKGIGKGVVQTGASGAALGMDLATNLTGALAHLLSNPLGHPNPSPIRLRRVIHRGGVIEHWNETRAKGQALLDVVRVHQAKHLKGTTIVRRKNGPLLTKDEYYNDHFVVADDNVLILADEHVLLVKHRERGYMHMTARETRKQKGDKIDLLWSVRVNSIKHVAVRVGADFNNVVLTLDSLAEAIAWDALELPILCLNADDATRICTTIENLADAPQNEPWDVPLLGDHLDLMGPGPHSNELQWQPSKTFDVAVEDVEDGSRQKNVKKSRGTCWCCGSRPSTDRGSTRPKTREKGFANAALAAQVHARTSSQDAETGSSKRTPKEMEHERKLHPESELQLQPEPEPEPELEITEGPSRGNWTRTVTA